MSLPWAARTPRPWSDTRLGARGWVLGRAGHAHHTPRLLQVPPVGGFVAGWLVGWLLVCSLAAAGRANFADTHALPWWWCTPLLCRMRSGMYGTTVRTCRRYVCNIVLTVVVPLCTEHADAVGAFIRSPFLPQSLGSFPLPPPSAGTAGAGTAPSSTWLAAPPLSLPQLNLG